MDSTVPLVSVVVVNHNRAALLERCLRSLVAQDYPNLEIIVVDNASTDDSLRRAAEFGQGIRLCRMDSNVGFAAGANAGIEASQGEWVALINNDAEASPDWISAMMAAVWDPEVGMCACKILFHGTSVIDKCGHLIFLDGQNRGRGTGEIDKGQYDESGEALFPDGCAALYRRRLLEDTGGFDEDFFAYADDADLGLRARRLGWRCLYVPQAVVHHRHSSTSGRFAVQKIYWIERNRYWLAVKNLPWFLLVVSPLLTLYRWGWNWAASLRGRGAAGGFVRQATRRELARTILRALGDGLRQTGSMWRKRRNAQKRISDWEFLKLLLRYRISARRLALAEFEE